MTGVSTGSVRGITEQQLATVTHRTATTTHTQQYDAALFHSHTCLLPRALTRKPRPCTAVVSGVPSPRTAKAAHRQASGHTVSATRMENGRTKGHTSHGIHLCTLLCSSSIFFLSSSLLVSSQRASVSARVACSWLAAASCACGLTGSGTSLAPLSIDRPVPSAAAPPAATARSGAKRRTHHPTPNQGDERR